MIHQTNYRPGNNVYHKAFQNEIMEVVVIDKYNPTLYLADEEGYKFDARIEEIGIEGYQHYRKNWKFGDVIENGHASIDNPLRFGFVIEVSVKNIQLTDGEGTFWKLVFDANSKIKYHANALSEWFIQKKYIKI